MTIQTLLAASAACLAALYFIRGMVQDLRQARKPAGSSCGHCSSGGCPAARKG